MSKVEKRKIKHLKIQISKPPAKQINNKRPMKMTFKNISKWNRPSRDKKRPCSPQEYLIFRRLTSILTNSCIRSRQADYQGIEPLVNSP